jgi:hypothetical protein
MKEPSLDRYGTVAAQILSHKEPSLVRYVPTVHFDRKEIIIRFLRIKKISKFG